MIKIGENEEVREFLDGQLSLHFSTLMKDGSPQTTPVGFVREGNHIVIFCAEGTLKVNNVRRDPRVALSINYTFPGVIAPSCMAMRGRVVKLEGGDAGFAGMQKLMEKTMNVAKGPYADPAAKLIAETYSAQDPNKSASISLQEPKVAITIEIDRLHYFLFKDNDPNPGVAKSLTEKGEKTSSLFDVERHNLWKKDGV